MMGGTSTGGLTAVMLERLKMTFDECQNAYLQLFERIFNPRRHKLNHARQTKDFLTMKGRFDSSELEPDIKKFVGRSKTSMNEFLQKSDLKCNVEK